MATFRQFVAANGGSLLVTMDRNIADVANRMTGANAALSSYTAAKSTADAVATDTSDAPLTAGLALASAQLASDFTTSFGGIDTLAQYIADLSEAAGLEGGASEIRIYKGGVKVAVTQDA